MMQRTMTRRGRASLPALALMGLTLLTPGVAQADHLTSYSVRPVVGIGGKLADTMLPARSSFRFFVGALADDGAIAFGVGPALANRLYQDGYTTGQGDWLYHFAKGSLSTIVAPGAEGPQGSWRADTSVLWPFAMNQGGTVAFSVSGKNSPIQGAYVWDPKERRAIVVAQPGMPAPDGGRELTFTQAGGYGTAINNGNDIALMGVVKDPNGPDGPGLFFLGRDGKMLPILLPGTTLPGGAKLNASYFPQPSINDLGVVAFLARRQGEGSQSAFYWAQGNILPIAVRGAAVPGGKISGITSVFVNNRNNHQLVSASVASTDPNLPSWHGVYRVVDGQMLPVAARGKAMPGGGTFRSLQNILSASAAPSLADSVVVSYGVSPANRFGEHVILANLEDNSTAAYRMSANGALTLIVKSGMKTKVGTITKVGVDSPAAINRTGQIALSVRIDNGAPTLVVLTPDT